jgi:hypothetical protein
MEKHDMNDCMTRISRRTFLALSALLGYPGLTSRRSAASAAANAPGPGSGDGYGGVPVRVGRGTGFSRVEKVRDRWVLLTLEGNAFWMLGVYHVEGSTHIDDRGSSYLKRAIAKYGDADLTWGSQRVRRLRTSGFNSLGEFSSKRTLPYTTFDKIWPLVEPRTTTALAES